MLACLQVALALALLVESLIRAAKPLQFSSSQQTPVDLICSAAKETRCAAYIAVPPLARLDAYYLQAQHSLRHLCGLSASPTDGTACEGDWSKIIAITAVVRSLSNTVLKVNLHDTVLQYSVSETTFCWQAFQHNQKLCSIAVCTQAMSTFLQSSVGQSILSGLMTVLRLAWVVLTTVLLSAVGAALHYVLRQETTAALQHKAKTMFSAMCSIVQQCPQFMPALKRCCNEGSWQLKACILQLYVWTSWLWQAALTMTKMGWWPKRLQVS